MSFPWLPVHPLHKKLKKPTSRRGTWGEGRVGYGAEECFFAWEITHLLLRGQKRQGVTGVVVREWVDSRNMRPTLGSQG